MLFCTESYQNRGLFLAKANGNANGDSVGDEENERGFLPKRLRPPPRFPRPCPTRPRPTARPRPTQPPRPGPTMTAAHTPALSPVPHPTQPHNGNYPAGPADNPRWNN
ncbi:hypothetical protein niasHT_031672 [Heterodera trifolii]|uniref:Uncharacterized protein n=1 Tax=Heterodera trifolii TaxID=157864 RepID=A0ABD2IXZ5_9BILA